MIKWGWGGGMGWKSNIKVHFSKQMLLFHLFSPFILWYEKKYPQFSESYCYNIPYMFSIFIKIIFECHNLLIDLVLYIIKHTEIKKHDLNATLSSQISSRN